MGLVKFFHPFGLVSVLACLIVLLLSNQYNCLKWILLWEALGDSTVTEMTHQGQLNIITSCSANCALKVTWKKNPELGFLFLFSIGHDFSCHALQAFSCFIFSASVLSQIEEQNSKSSLLYCRSYQCFWTIGSSRVSRFIAVYVQSFHWIKSKPGKEKLGLLLIHSSNCWS